MGEIRVDEVKDLSVRISILENKLETLEETIDDKISNLQKTMDEVRDMLKEYRDSEIELEKMIQKSLIKHNGYGDIFASKDELYRVRDDISGEIGKIYDRISELEKNVEVLKTSEHSFRGGQSFVIKYWSQILTIILTILLILQYFRG